MRLKGPKTCFELSLVNKNMHPNAVWDWWRVRIRVDAPQGRWSATDDCLLAPEVPFLCEWLEQIADGNDVAWSWFSPVSPDDEGDDDIKEGKPCLKSVEPVLSFEALDEPDRRLRVYFEYKFRPPWAGQNRPPDHDVYIDLPITAIALKRAAKELREEYQSKLWPKQL